MAKYKKGDVVICTKFDIGQNIVFNNNSGIRYENCVDDRFFNREAVIVKTSKDCMLEHLTEFDDKSQVQDREEYEIMFSDNNTTLAWVDGKDLIPKNDPVFQNPIGEK